jgi:hypothetical protein
LRRAVDWPAVKARQRQANALTYTHWLRGQDTASLFEDFYRRRERISTT